MKYPGLNSANSYLFTLEWRKYFWVSDLFGSFISSPTSVTNIDIVYSMKSTNFYIRQCVQRWLILVIKMSLFSHKLIDLRLRVQRRSNPESTRGRKTFITHYVKLEQCIQIITIMNIRKKEINHGGTLSNENKFTRFRWVVFIKKYRGCSLWPIIYEFQFWSWRKHFKESVWIKKNIWKRI